MSANSGFTHNQEPYYSYSRYLRERYGTTVYRIAVDAGFSCPHRGADRLNPGCSYCGSDGARAPYHGSEASSRHGSEASSPLDQLETQIRRAAAFLEKRYRAREFLLYFQAYSNTFGPVSELKSIYDRGLACLPFRELIVSTRPDCLDREKAALLGSYKTGLRDVWVELGLQSMQEETLRRVNRGHTVGDFLIAYELLKVHGFKVCVHLIFGLPGEDRDEIMETVRRLAVLRPDGVKIHNLHVVRGTRLAEEYKKGEVKVPGGEEHLEYVIGALELLSPETVIMRLTCDTPASRLIAPVGFPPKQRFLKTLENEMKRRGTFQGKKMALAP